MATLQQDWNQRSTKALDAGINSSNWGDHLGAARGTYQTDIDPSIIQRFNNTQGRIQIANYVKSLVPDYSLAALGSLSNDELLSLADQLGQQNIQRSERDKDRADAMSDFGAQLGSLTASKQRQAGQKGRINDAIAQTQGLAQMMKNY